MGNTKWRGSRCKREWDKRSQCMQMARTTNTAHEEDEKTQTNTMAFRVHITPAYIPVKAALLEQEEGEIHQENMKT
jgi:hypothetical protein